MGGYQTHLVIVWWDGQSLRHESRVITKSRTSGTSLESDEEDYVAAVKALSGATLVGCYRTLWVPDGTGQKATAYPSCDDRLRVTWRTSDGSRAEQGIPAPMDDALMDDGVTLDPADSRYADLDAAAKALRATDGGGSLLEITAARRTKIKREALGY